MNKPFGFIKGIRGFVSKRPLTSFGMLAVTGATVEGFVSKANGHADSRTGGALLGIGGGGLMLAAGYGLEGGQQMLQEIKPLFRRR